MKAMVYRGPEAFTLEDVAQPVVGPGDVLVKVDACGVCGTDLRIASGAHRAYAPGTVRIPGHEIAGTVVEDVPESGFHAGQTVFVAPNIGCGECRACRTGRVNLCSHPDALGITRDGAMAEYVLVPAEAVAQGNILPVHDDGDSAVLAMIEPLACVLRGSRTVDITEGDVVLICGAGPIGLLHVKVARLRNPACVVVSEPGSERRQQAAAWGADRVVDPIKEDLTEVIAEVSGGRGADAIIVAAPSAQAQEQSVKLAATAGRINFFGGLPKGQSHISLDTNPIHYRELVVTGTTANSTEDCREALKLYLSGNVDLKPLISLCFPLERSQEAFEAAASGQNLKVVLEP